MMVFAHPYELEASRPFSGGLPADEEDSHEDLTR